MLATIAAVVVAPIAVYIFPPRGANRAIGKIRVALATPVAELKEGAATRFDAPAGMAFVMADGGEQNAAGDPTFGGFLTRDQGTLRALAITCPHLGCSYAFDGATGRSSPSTDASSTDRPPARYRTSRGKPDRARTKSTSRD